MRLVVVVVVGGGGGGGGGGGWDGGYCGNAYAPPPPPSTHPHPHLPNHSNNSGIFNAPVDAAALGLRDYEAIVPHPMDLGTVKSRLQVRMMD